MKKNKVDIGKKSKNRDKIDKKNKFDIKKS